MSGLIGTFSPPPTSLRSQVTFPPDPRVQALPLTGGVENRSSWDWSELAGAGRGEGGVPASPTPAQHRAELSRWTLEIEPP